MINRLKGLSCYLSGPMDFAEDQGAEWRDLMTDFLVERNVSIFNPLKHVFHGTSDMDTVKRERMSELRANGNWTEYRKEMKDVNHWDLRALDLSSFVIVNYDSNIFMCGTHEEAFTANRQQKPVLLVLSEPKDKISSWMLGRFPHEHMFDGWGHLKEYLVGIDSDPDFAFTEADNRRWLFYDQDIYSSHNKLKGDLIRGKVERSIAEDNLDVEDVGILRSIL